MRGTEQDRLFAQAGGASIAPNGGLGFRPGDHRLNRLPTFSRVPVALALGLFPFLQFGDRHVLARLIARFRVRIWVR